MLSLCLFVFVRENFVLSKFRFDKLYIKICEYMLLMHDWECKVLALSYGARQHSPILQLTSGDEMTEWTRT